MQEEISAGRKYALNEEVFTEELGWYSYKALVQRVVELEAELDAPSNDGEAHA